MSEQAHSEAETQDWRLATRRLLLLSGWLLLLLTPVSLAIYWIADIGLRPIEKVSIDGALRHIPPNLLRSVITPHTERGYFGMDVVQLRESLQAIPWVESISVRRIWPDRLQVDLREQVPLARWGSQELLSLSGERFRPPPQSIPENLPWLDGPPDNEQRVLEHYQRFADLLKVAGLGIFGLSVDPRGSWRLVLDNGLELVLGRDHMAQRLWRLAQVYTTVVKPRAGDIQLVDLRYSNGFALNWRPQTPTKTAKQ